MSWRDGGRRGRARRVELLRAMTGRVIKSPHMKRAPGDAGARAVELFNLIAQASCLPGAIGA